MPPPSPDIFTDNYPLRLASMLSGRHLSLLAIYVRLDQAQGDKAVCNIKLLCRLHQA